MHHTAAFRTTVPPPEPELFDLFEEPGGVRPNLLLEPQGSQERVLQHTVEHAGAICPFVQILDSPVPQMGEQLVDVLRFFDTLCTVAEQVIDVPKIILEDIPTRTPVRVPQLVEQLVPTELIFVEQTVDIPVPGGGGRHADLQGFLRGQSSTAPHVSEERISERIVEQIVDIPGGGVRGLRRVQGSTASSSSSVSRTPTDWLNTEDKAFQSFFALFPHPMKVRRSPGTRVRECPGSRAPPL